MDRPKDIGLTYDGVSGPLLGSEGPGAWLFSESIRCFFFCFEIGPLWVWRAEGPKRAKKKIGVYDIRGYLIGVLIIRRSSYSGVFFRGSLFRNVDLVIINPPPPFNQTPPNRVGAPLNKDSFP